MAEAGLHDLALGQADTRFRSPTDDLGLEPCAEREGATEEEVSRHQRVGDAEGRDRGRTAPPGLPPVDDVVVEEGGRVDELERHRGLDRIVTPAEAAARGRGVEGEEHDGGTDAFPPRVDQVRRNRVQTLLARGELGGEACLDAGEIVLDRRWQMRGGRGGGAVDEGHHRRGRSESI